MCRLKLGKFLVLSVLLAILPKQNFHQMVDDFDRVGVAEWALPGRCGINCLYAMSQIEGIEIAYADLVSDVKPDFQGHSLAELEKAASKFGFEIESRFVSPEHLSELETPFIIHLDQVDQGGVGHFLLIVRYMSDEVSSVVVFDGGTGELYTTTADTLFGDLSGYVLIRTRRVLSFASMSRIIVPAVLGVSLAVLFWWIIFSRRFSEFKNI